MIKHTFYVTYNNDDVCHFGILGMRWGVRRFQNKDGSLTKAGKKRYGDASYLLREGGKTYKSVKEMDEAANQIKSNMGKFDIGDGIVKVNDEYGTSYEKKAKTDIGDIILYSFGSELASDENKLKDHFKNAETHAKTIVKNAANIIINDDNINNEWLREWEKDANGNLHRSPVDPDASNRLKKGLSNGQIDFTMHGSGKDPNSINLTVDFYPDSVPELGGHVLSVEMTIDKKGKIKHIDNHVQING